MHIQGYHIPLEIISYPMGYDILGYTYPIPPTKRSLSDFGIKLIFLAMFQQYIILIR